MALVGVPFFFGAVFASFGPSDCAVVCCGSSDCAVCLCHVRIDLCTSANLLEGKVTSRVVFSTGAC